jgi:membrane protein implicated in regulation of membrane protease activity
MPGSIEPGWLWLIGGVLLLTAEIIAPGFFLVFIGAAAIATGLFTVLFGLGSAPQLVLFVLYALLAVLIGQALLRQSCR